MGRDRTERQGRASPKVFRGSRPGDEAPSLNSNIVTSTTVIGVFLASINNTQWDKWRRRESTTGTMGVLHGGRGGNWHGCIAKTKHMAGSLVWSGLYGFWTFLIFFFFVPFWIASCSLFHHHRSKERVGWEEIPLMSGNVSCWLLGLLTSTCHCLRARALPHHLAMDRLCLFLFNKWGEGGKQSPCACVLI